MKQFELNNNQNESLLNLVLEYEVKSKNGTIVFFELKEFSNIISFYQDAKQPEKALEVVKKATCQHQFSVELFLKKAELYMQIKKYSDAFKNIEKAYVLSPNNLEVLLKKSEIVALLGAHNKGLSLLNNLERGRSKFELSEIAFTKAIIYELKEDYKSMFASLRVCLLNSSDFQIAMDKLWICVEMLGNFQENIKFLESFLERNPFNSRAWFNLGHSYICNDESKKSVEAFEYSFLLDKSFEFAYRDCAAVCIDLGLFRKALSCYEEVLLIIPPDQDILFSLGFCYLKLNKPAVAKTFFKNVIGQNKESDESYFRLAECYYKEGKWKKVIHYAKIAVGLDDFNEDYYLILAKSYTKLNEYKDADMYFSKATETAPESINYWVQYILFLMNRGLVLNASKILKEGEQNACGSEFSYIHFCIRYELGFIDEAYDLLLLALTENYSIHGIIYNILPSIKNNEQINHIISKFSIG